MNTAELEDHIKDCGRLMEKAMAEGNRQEAMDWLQAQNLAISQRSPEQQSLMHAEIDRRISEGVDYFQVMGMQHAKELTHA